jgi:hypothetical protein
MNQRINFKYLLGFRNQNQPLALSQCSLTDSFYNQAYFLLQPSKFVSIFEIINL